MRTRMHRRRWRRNGPAGRMVAGLLLSAAGLVSAPAQAVEPQAPGLSLTVTSARSLPLSAELVDGRIEQRTLALHGIPVRGAYQTVRVRPDGTVEELSARRPAVAPQLRPVDARVEASAVPGLVAAARGMADEPALEGPPQLVYLMLLDQPVLAWESQLVLTMQPEPSRPTVWVSAGTGLLLQEVEQVRSSRARIFDQNPAVTPVPIEVELVDIDVEEAGHPLLGTRVQAFNCVSEEPEEVSPWWEEGECYPLRTVFSDEQGDFLVPTPEVILTQDNLDPVDPYAEVSMYVHAERFLDVMKDRGIEQFQCELSSMLANFRTLEPSTSLDYSPLNNAYYTNQCDEELGPTMIFGQGSEVDFGYDADVIYHELGHGMVALLAPENLFGKRLRSDAALVDAGGINEALADYFSVVITDDAHLGDYVGRFWTSIGSAYIRDAENENVCPTDIIGQVHNDGEPFMAALWATRKRLDADGKRALDRAVFEALMRMPPDCDLETAAALVWEMAQREEGQGTLSHDEMALLHRSLDSRGLFDCPRVITSMPEVRRGRSMYLRRTSVAVHPFYPGPMQLRYEVPPGADDMVVSYSLAPRQSSDPVEARVLVKRGDEPIEFDYRLVVVDNPPLEPSEDDHSDPLRELTLVTGDWDEELEAIEVTPSDYELRVGGLAPGEVLHVMLVNITDTEAVARDVIARSSAELPDADPEQTAETDSDGPPAVDFVPAGPGSSGCACRSGEPGPGGGWLWGLGLLVAGRRRWRTRG